jgi:pyruvate formate lyase activating enzyme
VYVTNGYITPEALDAIGPYLDVFRVDIKGFSDKFYRDLAGIPRWEGILDVARRAQEKWHMHVEVVTNIVPTMNDDDEQLRGIAAWTRELKHLPPTPVAMLEKAYRIGKEAGLKFVYLGNVPGHDYENTRCYSCGRTIVHRVGYETDVRGLDGSKCRFCGAELNFTTSREAP